LTFEKEEKNIYLDQPTKINVIVFRKKNSQQQTKIKKKDVK